MSVDLKIDEEKDLAVFTATGNLSAEDIMAVLHVFYSGKTTTYALWNCVDVDTSEISGLDVEKMAGFAPRFRQERPGAKTAIVASDQMTHALSKLFILFGNASDLKVEVKLFETKEPAMNWLLPSS